MWVEGGGGKTSDNENFRSTIASTDKGRSEPNGGNVDYFSYLGSVITDDARCTRDSKSWITVANTRTAFSEKTVRQQIGLKT